jgi:hypothetical protein
LVKRIYRRVITATQIVSQQTFQTHLQEAIFFSVLFFPAVDASACPSKIDRFRSLWIDSRRRGLIRVTIDLFLSAID